MYFTVVVCEAFKEVLVVELYKKGTDLECKNFQNYRFSKIQTHTHTQYASLPELKTAY